MIENILFIILALFTGVIFGYFIRILIAQKKLETIETQIAKKISESQKKSEKIIKEAQQQAVNQRKELLKTQTLIFKRENILEKRLLWQEQKEKKFEKKVNQLREIKKKIENLKLLAEKKIEKISGLSKEEAKKELFKNLEKEYQNELFERIKKLERETKEEYDIKAKEILAQTIQKCSFPQTQELTTTPVYLPNEKIKGRIIGKEGRNIRSFEKETGVELIIDETSDIILISCFNPLRRYIAKIALEKLIKDTRIQPARIEKYVQEAKEQIDKETIKLGENALYETGVLGIDKNLIKLLGKLYFRRSYCQNVLLHSIEVSLFAGALAEELGADIALSKKAGLLHDIGKSIDHQVEGSHVEIGIKILKKFGEEEKVIEAIKSHHEEYPYSSIESVLVQTADQISGARPGARKDTLENYLKRLQDLENIALDFEGTQKVYAIQAGRELRVFVEPNKISDLKALQLAKKIANRIQEDLKYPGQIKVLIIRELKITEYAK